MSKALFFNALPNAASATGYDRNYSADDLSDFLSIVCDTGVVKTNTESAEPQGLKIVAASGMTINVNAGKAAIKGKAFINDALKSFTIAANGTTNNRYDYVVIKYDNNVSVRDITIELRTGTNSIPTAAILANTAKVKELMLAYITVAPSATSITQANITDTRGNKELCPWFTAVKGYDEYYDAIIQTHESTVTLSSITNTVITDLPSKLYNDRYSLIEVYTNGIKEPKSAFTASAITGGNIVITFTAQKAAQTKVTVILNNFIDGEGMATALAQYNQLLQDVADLKASGEFNYICNGVNDNIVLSNLVRAFYSTDDYSSLKINVIGNIGIAGAFSGNGTTTNPFIWFNFMRPSFTNRTATVDFTRASAIDLQIVGGTSNVVFRTNKINIIGANVYASKTDVGTVIRVTNASDAINYENCRFWITAYQDSYIAMHGTFTNCRGTVYNTINNSYCFSASSGEGFIKLNGGEYYAYTGDANRQSAIIGQSGANTVCILYGVSAPTSERSGYYQTNSLLQWVGGGDLRCTDLISALPMIVVASIAEIRGTITKSKANVV